MGCSSLYVPQISCVLLTVRSIPLSSKKGESCLREGELGLGSSFFASSYSAGKPTLFALLLASNTFQRLLFIWQQQSSPYVLRFRVVPKLEYPGSHLNQLLRRAESFYISKKILLCDNFQHLIQCCTFLNVTVDFLIGRHICGWSV